MYLYDYQRTQLRKLGRGGNYIVHGSRQVGITTILLNYALVYVSRDPGSTVRIVSLKNSMVDYTKRTLIDYIYAAKTTNVSAFNKLDVVDQSNDDIRFTNGGVIQLKNASAETTMLGLPSDIDVLIMDFAGKILDEHLLTTIGNAINPRQIIIGYTGSMNREDALYKLYINSLRGKNDFDYIRLPWDISENLRKRALGMRKQLTTDQWNMEAEMLPH